MMSFISNLVAKIAGKEAAHVLKLQGGPMDNTKPWYTSQTIWSDVLTILLALVGVADKYWAHGSISSSPAYAGVLTALGAMGIHGRMTAVDKIG